MNAYRQSLTPCMELSDETLGIRYLKVVKSPTQDCHVLDVMFSSGLRVTVDLFDGDHRGKVFDDLTTKVHMLRPTLTSELETMSEAIHIVSDCMIRTMSGSDGLLHPPGDCDEVVATWFQSSLVRRIRLCPGQKYVEYEEALEILRECYESAPP
jgi:hypothetical protein